MVSMPKYYTKESNAKVAICIPVRDSVTAAFSFSLAMLMKKCGDSGLKTTLHMVMGSEIASQRQQLAQQALETDCSHILWLDSDMTFPASILDNLLSSKKDIIACNYSTRVKPYRPVAFTSTVDMDERLEEKNGIHPVVAVGFGCMLIKRSVFENMDLPYFSVEWNKDYTSLTGEDLYFCNKARSSGFKIYIDCDMSNKISHIGSTAFTLESTNND
ncbi:hypothetical protein N9578_01520 [bacterium]|jgi:GT2 family glycosyltransferase|nr:hypothetical protein [bacterium]MDB4128712.1 hypothetical protein [bacterium]